MARDDKVATALDAAAEAENAGRRVLVYRQNVPFLKGTASGEIPDVAEVIEAIESRGWHLDQLDFDSARQSCVLLFRRPVH